MAGYSEDILNPPVTRVLRRFAPVLVVGVVVFGALGYLAGAARSGGFEATSSLVLQDFRAQTLFEPVFTDIANVDPERYANNQLAILNSAPVARRAAQLMGRETTDAVTQQVLDATRLEIDAASDVISITFSDDESSRAVDGANAVLQAYLETVESQAAAAFRAALSQLDAALAAAAADVDAIQGEWAASQSAALPELQQQFDRLIAEMIDISALLLEATPGSRPQLRAELADVIQQVNVVQAARAVEGQDAESVALRERLNEAVQRESALLARRNQLVADAEIPRSELAIASPAIVAVSSRTGLVVSTAAGAILGMVGAAAGAHWYSRRRLRFESERELGELVGAPLLGVVPAWKSNSLVPVATDASSPASGALRALFWTLSRRLTEVASVGDGSRAISSGSLLLVTSSEEGSAGAAISVNLAFASAEAGLRVLLIDADDGESRVSAAIRDLGADVHEPGLRDALRAEVEPNEATSVIDVPERPVFDFMASGTAAAPTDPLPGRDAVGRFVEWAESKHDLVILHVPRLPEQLHLGALLSRVPHSLLVVRKLSSVGDALDVVDRLRVVGAEPLGCVYLQARRW